jgi:type III pantothenate kinase
MTAAFINQIIADLHNRVEQPLEIFFTGGDGQLLSSLTNACSEYVEDLVLQGIINVKESIKKG